MSSAPCFIFLIIRFFACLPEKSVRKFLDCRAKFGRFGRERKSSRVSGYTSRMSDLFSPVHPAYCADPFVLAADGVYYAFGTTNASQLSLEERGGREFTLLRSHNLADWELLGGALEMPADKSLGSQFWAPEVARGDDGRFYLYYSIGGDGEVRHRLRVATSDVPEGPYRDNGITLIEQQGIPFTIDPHAFRDDDGSWYLFYARDFIDTNNGYRAGTGLAVDRMLSPTQLAGEERTILRSRYEWQRFQKDRSMPLYGTDLFDWHTLEGAFVVRRQGRYWCFYSGAAYGTPNYGVDVAVADHPLGPWDETGGANGPRVLRTIPGKLIGPGHNSIFSGPDGRDYIAFHAWNADHTRRQMHLSPLLWTNDGPIAEIMLNPD